MKPREDVTFELLCHAIPTRKHLFPKTSWGSDLTRFCIYPWSVDEGSIVDSFFEHLLISAYYTCKKPSHPPWLGAVNLFFINRLQKSLNDIWPSPCSSASLMSMSMYSPSSVCKASRRLAAVMKPESSRSKTRNASKISCTDS